MVKCGLIWAFALGWVAGGTLACSSSSSVDDDNSSAGSPQAGGPPASSAGAGPTGAGGSLATGGGTSAGAPNSSAGTSVGGSSMGGGAGTAGSGTQGPIAGSGGASPLCREEDAKCVDAETVQFCDVELGLLTTLSCPQACEEIIRREPGNCDAQEAKCDCGEPLNSACDLAAQAFCVCYEAATEIACTDEDYLTAYLGCDDEDMTIAPVVTCFAEYITDDGMGGGVIDCEGAVGACVPEMMGEAPQP